MLNQYSTLLMRQRKRIYYVPWISLISFIIVLAGTITWAVGTESCLKNTDRMLRALAIDLDAQFNSAQKVGIAAITACCVLGAGMLAMSSGRSCTEYAVDTKGAPARGTVFWLGALAIATVLWWLIMVLLMFVFFLYCIWLGIMYTVTQAVDVVVESADLVFEVGMAYHNTTQQMLLSQLGPLPDSVDPADCPATCLNVELLEYFLERLVCICGADAIRDAGRYAWAAESGLLAAVVGCFVVWIGASFLLMNASADFAQANRERVLLLRMQRAAAAGTIKDADGAKGGLLPHAPAQQTQQHAVVAGAGIELAVAAASEYGMSPYGNRGHADVDQVPLLKDAQQASGNLFGQQPYQPAYEQPYQSQQVYEYQNQRGAVAAERNGASAEGGDQKA